MSTKTIAIITTIVVAIMVFAIFMSCREQAKYKNTEGVVLEAIHDTVTVIKMKDGRTIYKKDIVQINSLQQLIKILQSDTSNLKSKLDSLSIDFAKIERELKLEKAKLTALMSLTARQDIEINSLKANKINDTLFQSTFKNANNWYNGNVTFDSKNESFDIALTTYDKYNVTFFTKKDAQGKLKTYAQIENKNPFSKVMDLNTFEVTQKPNRRIGLSITGGAGVFYNKKPQLGYGIIGGVSYRIF